MNGELHDYYGLSIQYAEEIGERIITKIKANPDARRAVEYILDLPENEKRFVIAEMLVEWWIHLQIKEKQYQISKLVQELRG